jgi:hypothetical protein
MKPVRRILFDSDPYTDLERTYPEDLQGWRSQHPVFAQLIESLKPKLIAEVGTWKGASAVQMAAACKRLNLETEIVCIDTWLGNWQHWSRESGVGSRVDLRRINGFPMLYFQFLSNVVAKGFTETITPLPLTSIAGANLFKHYSLRPDLVYLDAEHEYEPVTIDLRAWLALLAPNGVLVGDDYDWPGVKRAVDETVAEGNWRSEIFGEKFVLRRR